MEQKEWHERTLPPSENDLQMRDLPGDPWIIGPYGYRLGNFVSYRVNINVNAEGIIMEVSMG